MLLFHIFFILFTHLIYSHMKDVYLNSTNQMLNDHKYTTMDVPSVCSKYKLSYGRRCSAIFTIDIYHVVIAKLQSIPLPEVLRTPRGKERTLNIAKVSCPRKFRALQHICMLILALNEHSHIYRRIHAVHTVEKWPAGGAGRA